MMLWRPGRLDAFARWFESPGGRGNNFPVARLPRRYAAEIGAGARVIHLSPETVAKQKNHHPDLTTADYAQCQAVIERGEAIPDGGKGWLFASAAYVVAVKATAAGELYMTGMRRISSVPLKRDKELSRLRRNKKRR